MRYDIEIIGVSHVATCNNMSEVYDALVDSGCLRYNNHIQDWLIIFDNLMERREYIGQMAEDSRHSFIITVLD